MAKQKSLAARFVRPLGLVSILIALAAIGAGGFLLYRYLNPPACQGGPVPGSVIFYYDGSTTPGDAKALIASVNGEEERHYTGLHGYAIKVPKGNEEQAVNHLRTQAHVTSAYQSQSACPATY